MNKCRFWIIVIAMHTLCFGKQLFFQTSNLQDTKEYLFAAENIINHQSLYAWNFDEPHHANWLTKRPFLYPLILAFFKLVSFGNNQVFVFLILLVQNIISLCAIKLVEKTIMALKGKINYGLAAILIFLTPAQAIYANLIMSEIWLQLVLMLLLYMVLFKNKGLAKISLLALLCIAAMSLKPVMLFTAFCLPVYCLMTVPKKSILKPLSLSVLPLLFLSGVSKINAYRTGYFHYSSISTINLFQYNAYTLLINKYGIMKADTMIDDIQSNADNEPTYALKQQYLENESQGIIMDNLALYSYLHIRGAALCLLDPGRFDITQFFNLSHDKNLIYEINRKNNFWAIMRSFLNPLGAFLFLIFLTNLYKLYFGIRFVFSKTTVLGHKLSLLYFPCYILLFTGPIGSSRFAMPFFPIYLIIVLMAQNTENESPD